MPQHFLVELTDTLDTPPPFARIPAPDADTAITAFLTIFAPTDQAFLAYVASTAINLSFAEHFWIRTDADERLFEQGRLQLSDADFAERVQQFFGPHQDYAELYLSYYFSAEGGDPPAPNFPAEMLAYIWQHTGYGGVRAIPVAEG